MLDKLRDAGSARFLPVDDLVEERRRCKEPDEIASIESAARIVDAALEATAALARAGATERDVALELDLQMRRRGSEEPAFPTIVAAGPRSALPHAMPTDRRLAAGDLVCIDCGATVGGYHSDLTRAWAVGGPDAEQRRVHAAVLRAHDRALALVRPGALSDDLNDAAKEEFAATGIKDWWRHGVGHGVGLAIHEAPSLRVDAGTQLAAGDVVTIEPGAYRPGWGGVRVEDLGAGDGGRRAHAQRRAHRAAGRSAEAGSGDDDLDPVSGLLVLIVQDVARLARSQRLPDAVDVDAVLAQHRRMRKVEQRKREAGKLQRQDQRDHVAVRAGERDAHLHVITGGGGLRGRLRPLLGRLRLCLFLAAERHDQP